MPLTITAIYAGVLALIILALGINVTVHRVKFQIPLGDIATGFNHETSLQLFPN